MNKIFSIFLATLALSVASCSGSGSKSASNADTTIETAVDTIAPTFTLSGKGISDIVLGMQTSDIPESITGLYDRVDKYDGKSFVGYSFVLDSIETLNAEDTDFDGKINLIALRGKSPLKTSTGNGTIYLGMPLGPQNSALVAKEDGAYHIGNFKVQVQDGKVCEIYIEWTPTE